jgi:Pyruvate/2-oxoacid:ferredoxin oxidoreductase gamma subunit
MLTAPDVLATTHAPPVVLRVPEHTLEIVSDSGEGVQKCGQIFAAVSAKMGNGVWTVEIIPAELSARNYRIIPIAMEDECLTLVDNPRKGKNMFVLGILAHIYDRDMTRIKDQIAIAFRKKNEKVYDESVALVELGCTPTTARWVCEHVEAL